ncbi:MAG TPA: ABC transporter permease [Ktedonobacteraceae bacterium]
MAETVVSDAPPPESEQPAVKSPGILTRLGLVFVRQREASILVVALVLLIYFWVSSADFVSPGNIRTIFEYLSETAIIAVGEVFLLICGEIDLSVGQVFAFAPFIMYFVNQNGVPLWLSIIIALLASLGVGLLNGLITVWFKIPSLITTLGTQFLLNGITLTISNDFPVAPPEAGIVNQFMGAAPYSEIIWAVTIMIIFQIVLSYTRWGVHTFATGGNQLGASEAGVAINRIKVGSFMLTALLGGLSGILGAFRIDSIDPSSGGTGIMFSAVAGAVIGGTALSGGVGTVLGAFLGVLALSILRDGFTLLGVNANTYDIVLGAAILIAMVVNLSLRTLREAKR